MLNPRPVALCLMMALLAAAAPGARAASKPYRIAAAIQDAEGKWQPAESLDQAILGIAFRIRYLDAPEARRALSSALGREIDMLPGRVDGRRAGYLVFVLQIDNNAAQDVIFNPGQARLSTEKGDMKFALDYSALYEVTRSLGPSAPALDELGQAIFDRSVTIRPGGSVRKLLAFEAPREDRFKKIEVRLAEINVGPVAIDAAFPFRKFFEK